MLSSEITVPVRSSRRRAFRNRRAANSRSKGADCANDGARRLPPRVRWLFRGSTCDWRQMCGSRSQTDLTSRRPGRRDQGLAAVSFGFKGRSGRRSFQKRRRSTAVDQESRDFRSNAPNHETGSSLLLSASATASSATQSQSDELI